MGKQTTRNSITWMLILAVFAAPIFLISCSDDDDDNGGNGTSNNQNNNNNNNNQNQQDGSFSAEFTGGIQQTFEGNAIYLDSNALGDPSSTPYKPNEDAALTIRLQTKKSVKDSASVTATILKNEDNSPVSKGTYNVKKTLYLPNDIRTGATMLANTVKANNTLTPKGGGSIEITSRSNGVVKGKFNDVKLTSVSFGQGGVDSVSVTLTGSFACKKADL